MAKNRTQTAAFKLKCAIGSSNANRAGIVRCRLADTSKITGPLDRIKAILDERLAARARETKR